MGTAATTRIAARRIGVAAVLSVLIGLVGIGVPAAHATPGDSWTAQTAAAGNIWESVAYGDGTFVAVATSGASRVMRSSDGVNWNAVAAGSNTDQWLSVAFGEGTFVAVADFGANQVMTSTDAGVTWSAQAVPGGSQWRSVTYGDGQFVAVADSGTDRVMTSPDGFAWTPHAAAAASGWTSVTYGDGTFVAVAETGSGAATEDRVMTSANGVDWVAHDSAGAGAWIDVTYGVVSGQSTFVAVANIGPTYVMTSTDGGASWLARTPAKAAAWQAVEFGAGTFVAVARDFNTDTMASADGVSWATHPAAEPNPWLGLTYGDGLFVAVAGNGTHQVMTSGTFAPPSGTTTAITDDSPDPSVEGSAYTVSGTVTVTGTPPASGDLPGQVDVTGDGSGCSDTTLAETMTAGEYAFSCSITDGTVGTTTLTATYSGATGFLTSSDTESHVVDPAPTAIPTTTFLVSSSPNPTYAGFWYTVNGTVTVNGTPPVAGDLPGQVVVTDPNGITCTDAVLSPTPTPAEYAFSCVVKGSVTPVFNGAVTAVYTDSGTAYATSTSNTLFQTIDPALPPPTNVLMTTPGPGSRASTVSWTPPAWGPTPTGYQVRCIPLGWPFDTGPGKNPDARWSGSLASPVTITNLVRNVRYHCMVRARYGPEYITEAGDAYEGPLSAWSNTVTVPVAKPPAPTGVKASTPVGRSTVVSWTRITNDTGASVSFSTTCTSTNGGVTRTATGNTPVTVSSLSRGKRYTCKVTATNTAGSSTSAASNQIIVP